MSEKQKPKDEKPTNDAPVTYGNEPAVEDPKPKKQPDRYEA